MRKVIITILGLSLVAGVLAAPAFAGKTIKGGFTATAAPYPLLSEVDPNGCLGAQEGVFKVTKPFKAPAAGRLTVTMTGFEGDWDIFVLDAKGGVLGSATESQLQGAAQQETIVLSFGAKKALQVSACNWAGGPQATVAWKYVTR